MDKKVDNNVWVLELKQSDAFQKLAIQGKNDIATILNSSKVVFGIQNTISSVADILENLQLTTQDIVEKWPNIIQSSNNLAPVNYQSIYIASYLKEKGKPDDYESYKQFIKYLDVSSDIYRICLAELWKYISNEDELMYFFEALKYSFWNYNYKETKAKEFDIICSIITNIPSVMKDSVIKFMDDSTDNFIKCVKIDYISKWMR